MAITKKKKKKKNPQITNADEDVEKKELFYTTCKRIPMAGKNVNGCSHYEK